MRSAAPKLGGHQHEFVARVGLEVGVQAVGERLALPVLDIVSGLAEFLAELPHRGKYQRQLVGVVRLPAGELAGLYQQDALVAVGPPQRTVVS